MSVMHLRGELQAGQALCKMGLQRADHDEHEGLGIAPEGELKKIGELVQG